jgi:uncharacterized membrane protein YfcA
MTWQFLLIGLIAGIAGGMFGIGGGAIMVPMLVLWLGMQQKMATGTSLAAQVLPVALLGAIVYYRESNLNLKAGVLIAAGLLLGNLLGAMFANQPYISNDLMKKLYGVFMIVIGLRYLLDDFIKSLAKTG